jgi:hypothetical protein
MEEMAPTSPTPRNAKEYKNNKYEPVDMQDKSGSMRDMWLALRCNIAGKVSDNGTLKETAERRHHCG